MSENGPPVGSICHHEIPSPDLAAQQAFYGSVFGWKFTPMGPEYVLPRDGLTGDGLTGGGLDAAGTPSETGTVCVIMVDEVGEALARITAAGGRELSPKAQCGETADHGFAATFRDPCGNRLGIWSRT